MPCCPRRTLLVIAVAGWVATDGAAAPQMPRPGLPSPTIPTKSLPPGPVDSTWREALPEGGGILKTIRRGRLPVERSFSAAGITTVILRAAEAEGAEIITGTSASPIVVAGLPEGNEVGYHPADPSRERVGSPYRMGLDFAARPYGPTLVVSTAKEARFIHHEYHMVRLRVTVPPGVAVVKQARPIPPEPRADTTHLEAP